MRGLGMRLVHWQPWEEDITYHFHVIVRLEVETQGCQHDPAGVGDEGSDYLSSSLSNYFLIEVFQPTGVEGDLSTTALHNAVNLNKGVKEGRR